MLKTTIAGSLPKPEWLAEPGKLWPAWRGSGAVLERAKRDATLLWLNNRRDLVGDLSLRSERFRTLWARHEVRPRRGRMNHLTHPLVGDLDLQSSKLSMDGTDGLTLVVCHAEPGSRSAELLDILGSLTAGGAERAAPQEQVGEHVEEHGEEHAEEQGD